MNTTITGKSIAKMLGFTIVVCALVLAGLLLLAGCSNKPTVGSKSTDSYTVREYNADVDRLDSILSEARSLDHQIEAMGNPNNFTSQQQVDKYNNLVDRYNSVAEKYRQAVREFNSKYAENAQGDGNRATDPDNIQLPSKK